MIGRCPGFKAVQTKDDMRLHRRWTRHPKTRKLIRRLGPEAALSLLELWGWAADNRHTGILSDMTPEDIAIASDWTGDPDEWVRTLVEIRWLDAPETDAESDTVADTASDTVHRWHVLHDWAQHQPWIAALDERKKWSDEMNGRRKARKPQKRKRRKSRSTKGPTDTDTGTDTVSDSDTDTGVGIHPNPNPNPSIKGGGVGGSGDSDRSRRGAPLSPSPSREVVEHTPGFCVRCADAGRVTKAAAGPNVQGHRPIGLEEDLCAGHLTAWYQECEHAAAEELLKSPDPRPTNGLAGDDDGLPY